MGKCGAALVTLAKAASSRLRWNMPSAYVVTARFALSLRELNGMMKQHHEGGGPFKRVEDVACQFVQANYDRLLGWAKGCDRDSELDVNTLTCINSTAVDDDSLRPCSGDYEVCAACRMCIMPA